MTSIGVISDTHNHLDPRIAGLFQGVDHILHAGDIGLPWLILELEQVAPVTAVVGNTDHGLNYSEVEVLELGGRKFLLRHIVDVNEPDERLKKRLIREAPHVVVFGHTHTPIQRSIGGTLFLNPGYAGKPRFKLPRSVAILRCREDDLSVEFLDL